jgi:hypothetical protein
MAAKFEPTELQIEDGCKAIREQWTIAERCRRGGWLHKHDLRADIPEMSREETRYAVGGHYVERQS